MLMLETLECHVAAVMETLVEVAVMDLAGLLNRYYTSSAAGVAVYCLSTDVCPAEERPHFSEALTKEFTALLKALAKEAVEKILIKLKVSICGVEDGPAAVSQAALSDPAKQTSLIPKAEPEAGTEERKSNAGLTPADAAGCESSQCSLAGSEPEAVLTESTSGLSSDGSRNDDVQEHAVASTPPRRKKRTGALYKCPSCDKLFALKCLMERHHRIHSKPHLCSECGKRFACARSLSAHLQRHTGEKQYKCSECGKEFAYKYTLSRHVRRHSLNKPTTHTCTLCEKEFSGLLALQRHRCCALNKTFVCSRCPETFECRQSLDDHENLHPGERDFVCEMCGQSFFSSLSLATHRVTHTQKEKCCDALGLGCTDSSVLRSHLSKHTGEKLFSCEVCGKGCSHQSALKHHMLTHTGERPYICEMCGKRCGHASALQNHMRIHTGKKPEKPVCGVCGKSFRCTVNLKYHMSIHTGVRPYACDQCDKKFSNPSNLKLHMSIHTGEKMYGCNVCRRRFTQASSLRVHRLIHTGEMPFKCSTCGKEFLHRAEFRKHQKGHVSEEASVVRNSSVGLQSPPF
ncbi:uncharacterized protein V6R79_006502 [Siganus canaliculatus]